MIRKIKLTHKILSLVLSVSIPCFANNQELFREATSIGNKHKFNLNLKQNSTIDSYGKANKFESAVANKANAGKAGSQDMYSNISRTDADPNYLFNLGKQEIAKCETKSDARCSTINKYADKDIQLQLQEYKQPLSIEYSMTVTPDPTDKACSLVKRKKPLSTTINKCITATTQTQTVCNNTLTAYEEYIPQTPDDGIVFNGFPDNMCGEFAIPGKLDYAQSTGYLFNFGTTVFGIKSNMSLFDINRLPMFMCHHNGNFGNRGDAFITTTPTSSRIQLASFSVIHNSPLMYYQEPGQNCGVNSSTSKCTIKISLMSSSSHGFRFSLGRDEVEVTSWTIIFDRPKPASSLSHYTYNKGCP